MSLPPAYTNSKDYFHDALEFLSNYYWLFSIRNTHIITANILHNFPEEWREHFDKITNDELNEIPFGYVNDSWPESLKCFIRKIESLKSKHDFPAISQDLILPNTFKGLSLKKRHEILALAPIIHDYCKLQNIETIIDIGAGLGYLPQLLYEKYKYKILAVEADLPKLQTAIKRQKTLYPDSINHVKFAHHFVAENSAQKLQTLLNENFNNDENDVCLVGLHACADLTVSLLRISSRLSNVKLAIVMPCCYHRLKKIDDENSVSENIGERFVNFPVSCSLRAVYDDSKAYNFLTSSFLRLSCQNSVSSWRLMSQKNHMEHSTEAMRRNILQFVAEKEGYQLSRLKRKSHAQNTSFIAYLDNLKNTHLLTDFNNKNQIDSQYFREKIIEAWEKYEKDCHLLEIYTAFQTSIQNICENIVLFDRIQMVREWAMDCYAQKVTDDCISPRCFALVAKQRVSK